MNHCVEANFMLAGRWLFALCCTSVVDIVVAQLSYVVEIMV